MDILLFTVPLWDYYSPFLAVPCLIGDLKKKGFKARQIDLNVKYFNYVIKHNLLDNIEYLKNSKNYIEIDNSYKRVFQAETSEEFEKSIDFVDESLTTVEGYKDNFNKLTIQELNILDGLYHYSYYKNMYNKNLYNEIMKLDLDILKKSYDIEGLYYILDNCEFEKYITNETIISFSATGQEQFVVACIYAEYLRKKYKNNKFVLGGSYSNYMVKNMTSDNLKKLLKIFNYVSYAEGETSLEELIRYLKHNEGELNKVPGIVFVDENENIVKTTQIIEKVENLSTPDFDGINLEEYLLPIKMIPYQTSRGCFWGKCAFCDHEESYRMNFYQKSPKKVVDDLESLSLKYNIKNFQFVDEAIEPKFMEKMLDELEQRESLKDIRWMFYSRISRLYSDELVSRMYNCGCRLVLFGVESFSQRVLKLIKKGILVDNVTKNLKVFKKNGIGTIIWLIAGFPSQTEEEVLKDIEMIEELSDVLDGVFAGLFRLERNCDIYDNKEQFNIRSYDENNKYIFTSDFEGKIINQKNIFDIYNKAYTKKVDEVSLSHNRYIIYLSKIFNN